MQWHDFSVEKPKHGSWVMVWMVRGNERLWNKDYWDGDWSFTSDYYKITHWAYVNPPEGEDDGSDVA